MGLESEIRWAEQFARTRAAMAEREGSPDGARAYRKMAEKIAGLVPLIDKITNPAKRKLEEVGEMYRQLEHKYKLLLDRNLADREGSRWVWTGDPTEDNITTLAGSCVVIIRADELREIAAHGIGPCEGNPAPGWEVENQGPEGHAGVWFAHRPGFPTKGFDTEPEAVAYTRTQRDAAMDRLGDAVKGAKHWLSRGLADSDTERTAKTAPLFTAEAILRDALTREDVAR